MTNEEKAAKAHANNIAATEADGVLCEVDNVWVHSIAGYLKHAHPSITLEAYKAQFPQAALLSPRLEAAQAKRDEELRAASVVALRPLPAVTPAMRKPFAEVFKLGTAPAALNKKGDPIMITVLGDADPEISGYVPAVDDNYVFNIDLLKQMMMAFEMNIPLLAWGMHGSGKTTLAEQYAAMTNRPTIRVQHTISTEEAHILGQFLIINQKTVFNPGPLAFAMRYGLTYIADEYDFALPSVCSVYQPVLEGKDLIIKEACAEWRVVHPHPNFRFIATGNTNGSGDDTGLYQGTQMQNAANYSRFGITIKVEYPAADLEAAMVAAQGSIHKEDAQALVKVATAVRESYERNDIGVTISPRELIYAAKIGRALGGEWRQALKMTYTARLNSVDRQTVEALIQRVFGA